MKEGEWFCDDACCQDSGFGVKKHQLGLLDVENKLRMQFIAGIDKNPKGGDVCYFHQKCQRLR